MDNTKKKKEKKKKEWSRKSLARLSRLKLAKLCKSKGVPVYGNKKQQIHGLLLKFSKERPEMSQKSKKKNTSNKPQKSKKKNTSNKPQKSKKNNKKVKKVSVKTKKKRKTKKSIISPLSHLNEQQKICVVEGYLHTRLQATLFTMQDIVHLILYFTYYDIKIFLTVLGFNDVDLKPGDDVDVNPILKPNEHKGGWRCGEVDNVDDVECKINVFYEHEGDFHEIWVNLDNIEAINYIAECGTRVHWDDMLKHQYFEPYFNLKKNGKNIDWIQQRFTICLAYIQSAIENMDVPELIEYLNVTQYELYKDMLCGKIKELVGDTRFNNMKKQFDDVYTSMSNELKIKIDMMHLNIAQYNYSVNEETKSKQTEKIPPDIKINWYKLIASDIIEYENNKPDKDKCYGVNGNIWYCLSIKRLRFLLECFNKYFVKPKQENIEKHIDFRLIYDTCINYPQKQLADDVFHIEKYHVDHKSFHSEYLMPICEYNNCVVAKNNDLKNDDSKNNDVEIMDQMIKYHIDFSHRHIDKHGSNQSDIKRQTSIMSGRFVTEVTTNNEESKNDITKVFRLGYRFYYSDYKIDDISYIKKPKYHNLKIELLNNKFYHLAIHLFYNILCKAMELSLTTNAKDLIAGDYGKDNDVYEVVVGCPISVSQLLCIKVYTDINDLQYKFKKMGCRKSTSGEPLKNLKERNKEIGNWYWLFHQTILFYGKSPNAYPKLYTGLDTKLCFTNFKPSFECPISTTTRFDVAQGFSKGGIILELEPTSSSDDRGLDASWISCFPEDEIVFCCAYFLEIIDIRFVDTYTFFRTALEDPHDIVFSAIRLFDNIFMKNCSYNLHLLNENTQNMLIKLLKYGTFLDEIMDMDEYSEKHKLLDSEEYDSDAIYYDSLEKSTLNINLSNNFEDYLRLIFQYKVNKLIKWTKKHNLYLIESEYKKLSNGLQYALKELQTRFQQKVVYFHEEKWEIKEDEFKNFTELKTGKEMKGPNYTWNIKSLNNVSFQPIIIRSDMSFDNYCAVGLQINDVSSNIKTIAKNIYWSFSAKEIPKYSCDREHVVDAKNDAWSRVKAFENKHIEDLEKLTIKLYFRINPSLSKQ